MHLGHRLMMAGKTIVRAQVALAVFITLTTPAGNALAQPAQVPTTLEDFFEHGTQELMLSDLPVGADHCRMCHSYVEDGNPNEVVGPWDNWSASMMAQAARDPVWHAALAIANQDAAFAGDTCIRCHAPNAWLSGRSVPTDASGFSQFDHEGVSCNFCHRVVNPVWSTTSPPEDAPILLALQKAGLLPSEPGNARYVVDPVDVRRGPLTDVPANWHGVPIIISPFHSEGAFCGTCHDVSNPVYTRQANGTYTMNTHNAAHPTGHNQDMMVEQRTYSEWLNSQFASTGVQMNGRFGGNHPTGVMQSCQDCHMPKFEGGLCMFWNEKPFFLRPDVPDHSFIGANTWVQGAIFDQYGQVGSDISPAALAMVQQRTLTMLRNASDLQLQQLGGDLKARVINFSGHKLPTGYPEGRRMWLNVKFLDANAQQIAERGAYDFIEATLSTSDTKVYEARFGLDEHAANATGLPAGESFHLVLNNTVLKDNRIPPIGFSNSAFTAVQASPVNYAYADGQYWDDTLFAIPANARRAVVTLYYQTTSREYIEFLRDNNVTNSAGQNAYDRWVARGKSAPVDMDMIIIDLGPPRPGDTNHDGRVDVDDMIGVILAWGQCQAPNLCANDVNGDGRIDVDDLIMVILNWG
jgi:hypothetical protein